jgi:hypothetical protein
MSKPNCQTKPVNCECGNVLGEEVEQDGIILFHCGGTVNWEQRGECAQCGRRFAWSVKSDIIHLHIERARKASVQINKMSEHAQ